jgi:Domain of unknown function (DUF4262)
LTTDLDRERVLNLIRQNIAQHGYHTYIVTGGGSPRYAYTIGLSKSFGAELLIAGAYFYLQDELPKIIDAVVAKLRRHIAWKEESVAVGQFGSFSFLGVHESWVTTMMLGALDFYQVKEIEAFQIVPDKTHWTIEIPNLSRPWSAADAPSWQWLHEKWTYPVPAKSMAITNLGALRGERVTEAMRWEEDEWELFAGAGPDVPKEQRRVVPLGVLLARDKSLDSVVSLPIGKGLWRDAVSEWHPWGHAATSG